MGEISIKSLKSMKATNWVRLNELLRFFDGFDKMVEYLYKQVNNGLDKTLKNYNNFTGKPQYIKIPKKKSNN